MRAFLLFFFGLILASIAVAAETNSPQIEIEARIIESINDSLSDGTNSFVVSNMFKETNIAGDNYIVNTAWNMAFARGNTDLLCAPKLTVRSGETGTIKIVTEYIYPTAFDIGKICETNEGNIINAATIIPKDFVMREGGIIFEISPVCDADKNMIRITMDLEISQEPTWKEYKAMYEGVNGKKYAAIEMPFFPVTRFNQDVVVPDNVPVVAGSMRTKRKMLVEDRVPYLGAIPWFGRLFRSIETKEEDRTIMIVIKAKVLKDFAK